MNMKAKKWCQSVKREEETPPTFGIWSPMGLTIFMRACPGALHDFMTSIVMSGIRLEKINWVRNLRI